MNYSSRRNRLPTGTLLSIEALSEKHYIVNCRDESLMAVSPFELQKAIVNKIGIPVSMKKMRGGIYIEIRDNKQA